MSEYRDQKDFERYLQALRRFATPEELDQLLRMLGEPKDVAEFHAALSKTIQRQERWTWIFETARVGAAYLVGIGAAIIMIRDVLMPWLATLGAP